ncbi:hypothetical protein ACO1O0_003342 [Amphichorda felina]
MARYYPGNDVEESDVAMVSKVHKQRSIFPENTRLRKADDGAGFEVGDVAQFPLPNADGSVKLVKGDHSPDLERVCAEISEASNYAANDS